MYLDVLRLKNESNECIINYCLDTCHILKMTFYDTMLIFDILLYINIYMCIYIQLAFIEDYLCIFLLCGQDKFNNHYLNIRGNNSNKKNA